MSDAVPDVHTLLPSECGRQSPFASSSARAGRALTQAGQLLAGMHGLKSSFPLMLANMMEAVVTLVRNVALAHLIAPREFGLAISMSALIGIVDVLTDFGVPIYTVRRSVALPDEVVMATVHSVALIRAAAIAAILIAVAPLIAGVFGVVGETHAYVLLGVVAFARGFENFGVKAITREFRFGREATVVFVAQLCGFAITVAAAVYLRSFTCILWGMMASTAVILVLSHVLSPTRYCLGWNEIAARDIAAFGFPLLANGAAVAFCLSDRILIGALLNPTSLALYNVTIGTAQSPRCIAVKFLTSAFVPAFVRSQHSVESSRSLHDFWTLSLSGIAFLYAFSLTLFGSELLTFVFGQAYAPSREFMALTAMYIFVSFLMHTPVPPSYAAGQTKTVTYGSALYALGMVPPFVVLLMTRSLTGFVLALALSVLVSLVILLIEFGRKQPLFRPYFSNAVFMPFCLLALLAAFAHTSSSAREASWLLACASAFVAAAVAYCISFLGRRRGPTCGPRRFFNRVEAS